MALCGYTPAQCGGDSGIAPAEHCRGELLTSWGFPSWSGLDWAPQLRELRCQIRSLRKK